MFGIETRARRRVAAGAAYLDAKRPGWHQHVQLGRIDMASNVHCILGQLFGFYPHARKQLKMSRRRAIKLGFNTTITMYLLSGCTLTRTLRSLWSDQIELRREIDAADIGSRRGKEIHIEWVDEHQLVNW
jgi:hypothetical protein